MGLDTARRSMSIRSTPLLIEVADNDADFIPLDIKKDGLGVVISVTAYDAGVNNYATLRLGRARGTQASPTAVQIGDAIGHISYRGYDGNIFQSVAWIRATATENYSGSATGSLLSFYTTPNGSIVTTVRMIIQQSGHVIFSNSDASIAAVNDGFIRAGSVVVGGAGNVIGADLYISGGLGTGIGDAGRIILLTPRVAVTGDNTQVATTLMVLDEDVVSILNGILEMDEISTPAAPAVNGGRIYLDDSGGKTRLMVLFNTGAAIQLAIQV